MQFGGYHLFQTHPYRSGEIETIHQPEKIGHSLQLADPTRPEQNRPLGDSYPNPIPIIPDDPHQKLSIPILQEKLSQKTVPTTITLTN